MTIPAPEPIPDLLVTPIAEALLECLCAALSTSLAGSPCRCCVVPMGGLPPMDGCCACAAGNGQATVQVLRVFGYAAGRFPSPGFGPQDVTPCGPSGGGYAAELQLVVYRCMSCVDEDGTAPSCDELAADARKIWSDGAAMRRAVSCCDWRGDDDGETRAMVPGVWEPVSPRGCCGGSKMTVTVDLGPDCCPVVG